MNDTVTLHQVLYGKGVTGAPNAVVSQSNRTVFARIESVGMKEYYTSFASGHTVGIVVTMYRLEYENENELTYRDSRYAIVRTYVDRKYRDTIELHCERKMT